MNGSWSSNRKGIGTGRTAADPVCARERRGPCSWESRADGSERERLSRALIATEAGCAMPSCVPKRQPLLQGNVDMSQRRMTFAWLSLKVTLLLLVAGCGAAAPASRERAPVYVPAEIQPELGESIVSKSIR